MKNLVNMVEEFELASPLTLALEAPCAKAYLLHVDAIPHMAAIAGVLLAMTHGYWIFL